MLLDPESLDLVQHIETVLSAISGHELEERINAELMQSVLEIATPVCRTPADVLVELQKLRGYVTSVAPHGAGTTAGMLGFMFWAAERPATRGVTTQPPNGCEHGMGAGATALQVAIPMPPVRQQ